jgi:hypothetical protein
MSTKLVFQDDRGTTLHQDDILYDGLSPLPVQHELVRLPDGQRVTVISRQIAYGKSKRGESADVHIIFICQKEMKPTGGTKKTRF